LFGYIKIVILIMLSKIVLGAATISAASAADTAQWKGRAVYQVLTDRFAKSNGA